MKQGKRTAVAAVILCSALLLTARAADAPSAWAAQEVGELTRLELLPDALQNGYQDDITRRDFCRLILPLVERQSGEDAEALAAKQLGGATAPAFTDTADADVRLAASLGIVNGYPDGSFQPGHAIARQEAAKMLRSTALLLGADGTPREQYGFSDGGRIEGWARESVDFVAHMRVMQGDNAGRFCPHDPYTREESYLTVLRLYKALGGHAAPDVPPVSVEENTGGAAEKAPVGTADYAEAVVALVNEERAKAGLEALQTTAPLTACAALRASELEASYSHTRPDGSRCFTAFDACGADYSVAGENIAMQYRDPESVMEAWMNSEGHRKNILRADFGKIGVGVYEGADGTLYWCQNFTD